MMVSVVMRSKPRPGYKLECVLRRKAGNCPNIRVVVVVVSAGVVTRIVVAGDVVTSGVVVGLTNYTWNAKVDVLPVFLSVRVIKCGVTLVVAMVDKCKLVVMYMEEISIAPDFQIIHCKIKLEI